MCSLAVGPIMWVCSLEVWFMSSPAATATATLGFLAVDDEGGACKETCCCAAWHCAGSVFWSSTKPACALAGHRANRWAGCCCCFHALFLRQAGSVLLACMLLLHGLTAEPGWFCLPLWTALLGHSLAAIMGSRACLFMPWFAEAATATSLCDDQLVPLASGWGAAVWTAA